MKKANEWVPPTAPLISLRRALFAGILMLVYGLHLNSTAHSFLSFLVVWVNVICLVGIVIADAVCCAIQRNTNELKRLADRPPTMIHGVSVGGQMPAEFRKELKQ